MDALRSCYSTLMRFPTVGVVPIMWYWTDFPPLNETHVYGSHNHSREQGWDDADTGEMGEVWGAPRIWRDGSKPDGVLCHPALGSPVGWGGYPEHPPVLYPTGDPDGVNAVGHSYASGSMAFFSYSPSPSEEEAYGGCSRVDLDATVTTVLGSGGASEDISQPEGFDLVGFGGCSAEIEVEP